MASIIAYYSVTEDDQSGQAPGAGYQQKVIATSEWRDAATLQYCITAVLRPSRLPMQHQRGAAVAVRSKLLVPDPDQPGIRTLTSWPRVRHAATELPAGTF